MTEYVDGQIICWGGRQFSSQKADFVYSFEIDKDSIRGQNSTPIMRSRVMRATGDVHVGNEDAASVVANNTFFLMGGYSESTRAHTNVLSTLSTTGDFKRVDPVGEVPSPRTSHRAFAYDNCLYFLGGNVSKYNVDRSRPTAYSADAYGMIFTNELYHADKKKDALLNG